MLSRRHRPAPSSGGVPRGTCLPNTPKGSFHLPPFLVKAKISLDFLVLVKTDPTESLAENELCYSHAAIKGATDIN